MFHTTNPLKDLQVDFCVEITKIDKGKRENLMAKSGIEHDYHFTVKQCYAIKWKRPFQLVVNTLLCNN